MTSSIRKPEPAETQTLSGLMAVFSAFLIWGLLPLYLKPLNSLPALQIAA